MKKTKKGLLILCAFLAFFFGVTPKQDKAEASATAALGGFGASTATLGSMSALFPAIVPILAIGLFGCLLAGVAYSNWDEIYAFGTAVANELASLGYKTADFVSGTTVSVNDTLKQAVYKAADNMKSETEVSTNYYADGEIIKVDEASHLVETYYTNFSVRIYERGVSTNSTASFLVNQTAAYTDKDMYIISNSEYAKLKEYNSEKSMFVFPFEFTVRYSPVDSAPDFTMYTYSSARFKAMNNLTHEKNSAGQYVKSTGYTDTTTDSYYADNIRYSSPALGIRNNSRNDTLHIEKVEIPFFGIGVGATARQKTDTTALVGSGYAEKDREKLGEIVFPPTPNLEKEEVEFNPDAGISGGLGILDLPEITDKTIEKEQEKEATPIINDAKLNRLDGRVGKLESGLNTVKSTLADLPGKIVSGIGTLFSWLKGLLQDILTAIKAVPSLIITGLDNLFEDLGKVWTGIKDISQDIYNFLDKILSGMFDSLINAVNSLRNITSDLLGSIITGIKSGVSALSDVFTAMGDAIVTAIDLTIDMIMSIVIPSDLALERHKTKINKLQTNIAKKFEFITIPMGEIKGLFANPKSLYDVKLRILEQDVHVLPKMFKPVVQGFRPVFSGIVVLLTILNIYRRFSADEVIT